MRRELKEAEAKEEAAIRAEEEKENEPPTPPSGRNN
jgi:hypothetical protein